MSTAPDTSVRPPQIYGAYGAQRIKWTCGNCDKRNDAPLPSPLLTKEFKHCKFCRSRVTLTFSMEPPKDAGTTVPIEKGGAT